MHSTGNAVTGPDNRRCMGSTAHGGIGNCSVCLWRGCGWGRDSLGCGGCQGAGHVGIAGGQAGGAEEMDSAACAGSCG
jgi:hypothetical protein